MFLLFISFLKSFSFVRVTLNSHNHGYLRYGNSVSAIERERVRNSGSVFCNSCSVGLYLLSVISGYPWLNLNWLFLHALCYVEDLENFCEQPKCHLYICLVRILLTKMLNHVHIYMVYPELLLFTTFEGYVYGICERRFHLTHAHWVCQKMFPYFQS